MHRSRVRWSLCLGSLGVLAFLAAVPVTHARAAEEPAPASPAPPVLVTEKQIAAFDLLTLYKDNYFVTGFTHDQQVKLQFSVKFDLWPNEGHHAAYFAFSQRSRWNLYDTSAPFAENNYNPEVFYAFYHHQRRYDPPPGCGFFRERLGIEHESDGESSSKSRGWNRIYAASRFTCMTEEQRYLNVELEVWAPPFGDSDNPDISRYVGYGELSVSIGHDGAGGWMNGADLTVTVRKGMRDWNTGSVEIDAKWKLPYPEGWRFTPQLYLQVFHGYGDTLLSYNEVQTTFRVGIAFSDRSTRSR